MSEEQVGIVITKEELCEMQKAPGFVSANDPLPQYICEYCKAKGAATKHNTCQKCGASLANGHRLVGFLAGFMVFSRA